MINLVPRGGLSDSMLEALRPLEASWQGLGLTPTTYSAGGLFSFAQMPTPLTLLPDLLAFAYLAQCRCDPAGTPRYFTYFADILKQLQEYGSCPTSLQELMAMEQSRDRFTLEDVDTATTTLGFGAEGVLSVDYDEEIPEDFVENAWKESVKRAWRDPNNSDAHRLINEAFRILAETRSSIRLRKSWEAGKKYMNPDRAYNTLEIPKDVDDYMLITVYNMRVRQFILPQTVDANYRLKLEETPLQIEKMREAMTVIAEVRDSERLRQFLSSGQDRK